MQPLEKSLRNILKETVKDARDNAEEAAIAALEQLGVGEAKYPSHLDEKDQSLRKRLRIHGRQLGDVRKTEGSEKGKQEISRLTEEVAYEHWHRMLFARFLAENNLLMYPDPVSPVPVTLAECEDLAAEENAKNGWEVASRYASRMLPQIFRAESPVFELTLPPEKQQKLEAMVAGLAPEIFQASDALGWVYQFWQEKRKKEVNLSGVKIGARELPSQTQLFTEPYMVSFLLDNSLGAWWAARRLTDTDLKNAENEDELRRKAALPGVPLEYLRFVRDETGTWTPAAGVFEGWPDHLSELKTLDPCCGSGHFLVAALLMLVPIRMEMEGLTARDAVDMVISENLHGLEIDQRCVELAAFALAMTAWKYPDAGEYRQLPEFPLACSGLSINAEYDEWISLAEGDEKLGFALDHLYRLFKEAPTLGSLIDPAADLGEGKIVSVSWDSIEPLLKKALSTKENVKRVEMGVVAQGLARAASILAGKYHWIITNVPYLARGKQSEMLMNFCSEHYQDAKSDISTVFFERILSLCLSKGSSSLVIPQNWLFLTSYKKLRQRLLSDKNWRIIARLGPGAFETITGEVVKAILITITNFNTNKGIFYGLDVINNNSILDKQDGLKNNELILKLQSEQLTNPDFRVIIGETEPFKLLSVYANGVHGFGSKDSLRYFRQFWEIIKPNEDWQLMSTTVDKSQFYGGKQQIVFWQNGKGVLAELAKKGLAIPAGELAWGKNGVAISQMSKLPATIYNGEIFDKNVAVISPKEIEYLLPIWCYCSSSEYFDAVRQIDQSLKVTNATLVKVPFDLEYWTKVAAEQYPNGLPKPYSNDPTQWIFHGHPAQSDSPLQVAVARLLGYQWPAELDPEMELSDEQREWVRKSSELLSFADDDGVVCVPSVRGEPSATDRLHNLLAAAYGDSWSSNTLNELLSSVDHAGKTLDRWLRDKFFTQHCKLFQNRPFIWHIWDGLPDGFAVLVNYHKLDRRTLESLIFTYLGDWISRQKRDLENQVEGAEEKIIAAEQLKKRLELILKGEDPYDIFVRWKPPEEQPIGWEPDLNDGVRLNIRPFMSVPDVGKRGAGVLRDKPNITWGKDRGQDVETAPWYKLGPMEGGNPGDRINDHHLTLEEKKNAREKGSRGTL